MGGIPVYSITEWTGGGDYFFFTVNISDYIAPSRQKTGEWRSVQDLEEEIFD